MCSEVMDILKVFKIEGYSVGGLKRNRIAYKRCVLQSGPNQSRKDVGETEQDYKYSLRHTAQVLKRKLH